MNDMAISNLDVVKISGFDCIVRLRFYSTFLFFLLVPLVMLVLVSSLKVYGGWLFHTRLTSFWRECHVCRRPLPTAPFRAAGLFFGLEARYLFVCVATKRVALALPRLLHDFLSSLTFTRRPANVAAL